MDRLYDAIGGLPALEVAIERFCERLRADLDIAAFFRDVDLHKQKSHLLAYLGQAVGGPVRYDGETIRRAHAHVRIEQRHFDAVADHLAGTLLELGIGDRLVKAIMGRVRQLGVQIVNTESVRAAAA